MRCSLLAKSDLLGDPKGLPLWAHFDATHTDTPSEDSKKQRHVAIARDVVIGQCTKGKFAGAVAIASVDCSLQLSSRKGVGKVKRVHSMFQDYGKDACHETDVPRW
jgi:hypothetical protein